MVYKKINFIPIPSKSRKILVKYLFEPPHSYREARNKLIVCLSYYTGLQTWVIRELKVKDYNPKKRTLCFRFDTGILSKKEVVVEPPVSNILDYVAQELQFPERPLIKNPFWDSKKEKPMSARQIERIIKDELEASHIHLPNITLRALRHYAGLRYILSGATAFTLRELTGKVTNATIANYRSMSGLARKRGFY